MSAVRKQQLSEAVKRRGPQLGLGRFEHVDRARAPANGVAKPSHVGVGNLDHLTNKGRDSEGNRIRPVPSVAIRTAVVAVPDPLAPNERIQATVNRCVDILEMERSHGRITDRAYTVGQIIVAAYEGRHTTDQLDERVDRTIVPDKAVISALARAQQSVATQRYVRYLAGIIGEKILRSILIEGMTYASYAANVAKKPGERGTAYVAGRFRSLLEEMAERWDVGELRAAP